MDPNGLDQVYFDITVRLVGSLLIGGLIPCAMRVGSREIRPCDRGLDVVSDSFEYQMTIRTNDRANAGKLTQALNRIESIKEYRISPTGD